MTVHPTKSGYEVNFGVPAGTGKHDLPSPIGQGDGESVISDDPILQELLSKQIAQKARDIAREYRKTVANKG